MTPSFIFFSLIAVFITEMVILHKYVLLLLFITIIIIIIIIIIILIEFFNALRNTISMFNCLQNDVGLINYDILKKYHYGT